ncbi:MAG: dihydropteroate synthase, partial [Pirellulales bacterium]|nr:dihydropteroate synthase [Pirellulales bacterium]
ADILDIGGESTRPGAEPVSEQQEIDRVAPLIERVANEFATPLSIDTCKPKVAAECLKRGAVIVNDVTGLRQGAMLKTVRKHDAAVIIMHMRGEPQTMQNNVEYDDVIGEVKRYLRDQVDKARTAGVKEIVVDPGIGFGKSAAHNFELLRRLGEFRTIGEPVLIGPSRKSFLGSLPSKLPVDERLEGTIAACCAGVMNGASIVRVHDVKPVKRAIEAIDAIRAA